MICQLSHSSLFSAYVTKKLSNREPALVNGVNTVSIYTVSKYTKIRGQAFALRPHSHACDCNHEEIRRA
jgi:hypothetical protein